jgi:hypothetical protein
MSQLVGWGTRKGQLQTGKIKKKNKECANLTEGGGGQLQEF